MKRWLVSSFGPGQVTGQVRPDRQNLTSPYTGVLVLGQAEGRTRLALERVALNWVDSRTPDNAGVIRSGGRVLELGPEVHWSNIEWDKMPLPAHCQLSYSAGVFVCNHLLFELMEWAKASGKLGGFIHIPLLNSQVEPRFEGLPKMNDAVAIEAARDCLKLLLQ